MMINTDDLLAFVKEQQEKAAMRTINTKTMTHDDTQFERGRYLSYKELAEWIIREYGLDGQ